MGDGFLDGYDGQTTAGLLALRDRYRSDSLVLAFELGLQLKAEHSALSRAEQYVLAIEALEREVNNGGYGQFFLNASNTYAAIVVEALFAIDCPKTARVTRGAIAALKLPEPMTPAGLEARILADDLTLRRALHACDERYLATGEAIADRLLAWIAAHAADIVIPSRG